MRKNRHFRDTVIILVIVGILLVSGELVLRGVYGSQQTMPSVNDRQEIAFEPHPIYLVGLKPNLKNRPFMRKSADGPVVTHWNTNSASFRGAEIGEKSGIRIIVYGDSNIFARFSNLEDTFPCQLERMLRTMTRKPIEVLNAGVPGFGPDQSLLRFEQEVDVYKPDIVVFHVFADNDWGDIIRNRLFALDQTGRLVRTLRHNDGEVDACLRHQNCVVRGGVLNITKSWASSLLVVQAGSKVMRHMGLLNERLQPTPEDVIQTYLNLGAQEFAVYTKGNEQRTSHFVDHYDYDVALFPDRASSQEKIRLMDAVLLSAYQTAQLHGVKFVLLIEPSARDMTTSVSPNYENFTTYSGYTRRNLSGAIGDVAKKYMIPAVDLYDIFSKNIPEELYWGGNDDHWSNAGQQLAALHMATYLNTHFIHD